MSAEVDRYGRCVCCQRDVSSGEAHGPRCYQDPAYVPYHCIGCKYMASNEPVSGSVLFVATDERSERRWSALTLEGVMALLRPGTYMLYRIPIGKEYDTVTVVDSSTRLVKP